LVTEHYVIGMLSARPVYFQRWDAQIGRESEGMVNAIMPRRSYPKQRFRTDMGAHPQ
jgi:hypothetical protein